MNFKKKDLPKSQIELEVSLDDKRFKQYWDIAYEKARLSVTVKGFRPGSAPKEMTDAVIDKEKVFDESVRAAVRDSLSEITEDNKWQVIDKPEINVIDAAPEKGLKFKTTVTIFPEVKLPDYKKIASDTREEFKKKIEEIEISEEEITKSLDWLRESRAPEVAVEREVKTGDLIEVDIKTVSDGELVEGAQLNRDKFVVGKSNFIPGFDEKLVGHKRNEPFSFSLTAPNDYWNEKIRGKNVDFAITIKGIFERKLQELNDDFASNLGPSFKTLDDLKKSIAEGTKKEKESREREKMKISIVERISEKSKAEPPQIMIDRTLDNMIKEFAPMIQKSEKSEDELRIELKDRAEKNVMNNLVIHAILKKENLEPTKEEIEKEKDNIPADLLKGVDEQGAYDYIYGVLSNRKVFNFLESNNE